MKLRTASIITSLFGLFGGLSMALATEHTVMAEKFVEKIDLKVAAVPVTSELISLKPLRWGEFKILSVVSQGSIVQKGDSLITVDTIRIDKEIERLEESRTQRELKLEKAQHELDALREKTPRMLADAKRHLDRYNADFSKFTNENRAFRIESSQNEVRRKKDYLSYAEEELTQLLKMYAADGLTEETEEIIVLRAKNRIRDYKRELLEAEKAYKDLTEITLPREDEDWKQGLENRQKGFSFQQEDLPRNLKIKEEELESMKRSNTREQERLDELKKDREMMAFPAPIDGIIYYGEFREGRHFASKMVEQLKTGSNVPTGVALMSVVAEGVEMTFNAFLNDYQRTQYKQTAPAYLKLENDPWSSSSVTSSELPKYPNIYGQWLVKFSIPGEMPVGMVVGQKGNVAVVISEEDGIITVPKKMVKIHPDGTYSVKVKVAEGDPKETLITVGRVSGDSVEVTEGLTEGQVICKEKKENKK